MSAKYVPTVSNNNNKIQPFIYIVDDTTLTAAQRAFTVVSVYECVLCVWEKSFPLFRSMYIQIYMLNNEACEKPMKMYIVYLSWPTVRRRPDELKLLVAGRPREPSEALMCGD